MKAAEGYLDDRRYGPGDLFSYGGLWHSWDHHGCFSGPDAEACLSGINALQQQAAEMLRRCRWLVLSFGSAHAYRLAGSERVVANCHRMPADTFEKVLLSPARIIALVDHFLHRLFQKNPGVQVLFTVSPVRYRRDGMVESNLSKAHLFTAVHHLAGKFDGLHYFPAYELVSDDLRDYRFYEPDMIHPNQQAVNYVWEKLVRYGLDEDSRRLLDDVTAIVQAAGHLPRNPGSEAHRAFCRQYLERAALLESRFPFLDFSDEKVRFRTEDRG